jgi:omega-amidase
MQPLTITLIQTNLHWEDKTANLQMLAEKINSISVPTEVVVLPEMFSTGFSMQPQKLAETMDGETITWMKKMASTKNIILTGSVIIEEENKYYNRLIWMLPNGQYGYYNKRHLFAFANEHQHYAAGNKRLIAQVKGWKINLQVCYDLRFPVWARQTPNTNGGEAEEFDIILYVANWPERRSHPWKTLLTARAIENQCYAIGVNRVGNDGNNIYHSGNSMVVDPLGNELYHKANDEDIFTLTLQKDTLQETRNKFPFLKDADSFVINNE